MSPKVELLHLYLQNVNSKLKGVQELLKRGVGINSYDTESYTPLHHAVRNPNSDHKVIEYLLENGADVHAYNQKEQCNSLHYAARNRNVNHNVIEMLLKYQANVNAKNYINHCNALIYATQNPNMSDQVIELLLKHRANVNARNYMDCWYTPLHYAVTNPNFDENTIKILLKYGADIHCECAYNDTPLHLALVNDAVKFEVVKLLLSKETKYYHALRKTLESYGMTENSRLGSLEILKYMVVEQVRKNPRCINDFYTCRSVLGEEYFKLISSHRQRNILATHVRECVSEITCMKSDYINKHWTVYLIICPDFPNSMSIPKGAEPNIEKLLAIWFDGSYPIYSGMIQSNVKKEDVVDNLTTFRICARSFDETDRITFLDNASTLEIAKYININDLINLVKAFYHVNKDPMPLQCNTCSPSKRRKFD